MSKLPKAFKRKDHDPMKDFTAIPAGEYVVKITDSSYVANSKKNGHILKVILTVQNKEHKGAKIFVNLNLDNPSEKAVEIANSELATLSDAIGKAVIKDTNELVGKMLVVKVNNVDENNNVKMYSKIEEGKDDLDDDDDDDDKKGDDDSSAEVDADEVKAIAKKCKKAIDGDDFKELLEDYDIKKIKEIDDLDDDDLESLKEDLEEALEDA